MIECTIETPIGRIYLSGTVDAVAELRLPPNEPLRPTGARSPALDLAERQLTEYFAGERTEFDVPLAMEGTKFQREVWEALCTIPFGETCSYIDIARQIGRPLASRAVGQANGRNPISIIVPCHRVIAADRTLGGYGGGLLLKETLLKLEGASYGPK